MNRRVGLEKKGWTGGGRWGSMGAGGGGWREAGREWRLPDGRGRWRGVSLGRTAPPGRQPSPLEQMAFSRRRTPPDGADGAPTAAQAAIAPGDPCRHHDGDVHHGGGGLDRPRSWCLGFCSAAPDLGEEGYGPIADPRDHPFTLSKIRSSL